MYIPPTPANDPIPLEPYLARERAREAARAEHNEDLARRGRGVAWSGLTGGLYEPRTDAEIKAAAARAMSISQRFAASSRGRFLTAIANIQRADVYAYEAELARKAYCRGFSDENRPICTHEVGVALDALAGVIGEDGVEARRALAELLMLPVQRAA